MKSVEGQENVLYMDLGNLWFPSTLATCWKQGFDAKSKKSSHLSTGPQASRPRSRRTPKIAHGKCWFQPQQTQNVRHIRRPKWWISREIRERESESDTKKRRNGTHVIAGKHVLQMQSSKVCFFRWGTDCLHVNSEGDAKGVSWFT